MRVNQIASNIANGIKSVRIEKQATKVAQEINENAYIKMLAAQGRRDELREFALLKGIGATPVAKVLNKGKEVVDIVKTSLAGAFKK